MPYSKALVRGWLSDTPTAFVDKLLSIGRTVRYSAGDIVFSLGANEQDLYGIADGAVKMCIMNEAEQRLLHIAGPGFWFGEAELIKGIPRTLEAFAATDLCLMVIRKIDFLKLTDHYPDAWRCISMLAVDHQLLAIGAGDDLMLSKVQKRVAAILLRFSGNRLSHPTTPAFNRVTATQQEIAMAANISRATAARVMRAMVERGEIGIEYGSVAIHKPEALQDILSDKF